MTDPYTSTGMSGFSEKGPEGWDFAVGSVTGYRWWYWHVPPKLAGFGGAWIKRPDTYSYLIGARSGEWEPGRIEAECDRFEIHEPPSDNCGCGFWAYWDSKFDMKEVLYGFHMKNQPMLGKQAILGCVPMVKLPVMGVVEGSGRTIIGTRGFRSQYARITALCIPDEAYRILSWDALLTPNSEGRGTKYDYQFTLTATENVIPRITEAKRSLGELYPDAEVFFSREKMAEKFPPDENYGG